VPTTFATIQSKLYRLACAKGDRNVCKASQQVQ
jgi:hypothetical protein